MAYRLFKWFLFAPLLFLLYDVRVSGRWHLPKHRGYILGINHLAISDSLVVAAKFSRPVIFGAKKEYFSGKGRFGKIIKWFFESIKQIPVDRSNGSRAVIDFINRGIEVVRHNGVLGIHVEGTRSPDGRLYKARIGFAKIAMKTGVPVVPVAIIGTNQPGLFRRKVEIKIGQPIYAGEYEELSAQEFATLFTKRIQELSLQEYVDEYAPIKSNQLTS